MNFKSYHIDIPLIDQQHDFFVHLLECMEKNLLDKNLVLAYFGILIEYANKHMQSERSLMDIYQFPMTEEHIQSHAHWIQKLNGYHQGFRFEQIKPNELMELCKQWFIDHTYADDQVFGQWAKNHQKAKN